MVKSGLDVIKLKFILKLEIKRNDVACGHVSPSSQLLCFILSLRLYSSFITSKPDNDDVQTALQETESSD